MGDLATEEDERRKKRATDGSYKVSMVSCHHGYHILARFAMFLYFVPK